LIYAANGPSWSERETELLTILRPCCTTEEVAFVLAKLGSTRTLEAISRKARRHQVRFVALGDPTGEFSEEESAIIDEMLQQRAASVPFPATDEWIADMSALKGTSNVFTSSEVAEDEEYWRSKAAPKVRDLDPSVNWITGDIPLHKDRVSKFIMLNDIHVPHNIPLSGIFSFVRDFKPDYIFLVGDIVNNDPFDHWAKEKPGRAKKMPTPKAYYKLCNDLFFNPLAEAAGNDCKIGYWLGNHEQWSNRAIEYMPEGEGYWEVWNNVDPDTVDFWVPWKGIANLGHLHFTHGDIIRGGKYHPWQMLQYFHRNIRYGHYHDVSTASYVAPIDQTDRHIARCNGCLEEYNPHFMENRPHNWQHAFTYGYVKPDGIFNDYQVVIFDNKFIVNGKAYEGK
jgi:predicted phosphodiesterase